MAGGRVPSAQAAPQEAFWAWFVQNTDFLKQYDTNREPVLDEIGRRLHEVHEGLTFEIGQASDGVFDFIISADGIQEVFPEVVRLTKAAPRIEGWRIISFRPRAVDGGKQKLEYGGLTLSYSDLRYRSEDQGEKLGLTLFVRGLSEENETTLRVAAYLLLDTALGEYDVETRIGSIDLAPLPEDAETSELTPFKDLAAEVDCRFPSTAQ
ncbi:MAG: hypothetical protein OEU09_04330 [Rhodospirillales bacterium]|nr:hypothetical protein [Rhodospirillales bacterium]MDH3910501.1 hypothetical protein [Rhodospirillales bacterium]MDH3917965.1 hypothetical protein [Rhodospirillales bacterium]